MLLLLHGKLSSVVMNTHSPPSHSRKRYTPWGLRSPLREFSSTNSLFTRSGFSATAAREPQNQQFPRAP